MNDQYSTFDKEDTFVFNNGTYTDPVVQKPCSLKLGHGPEVPINHRFQLLFRSANELVDLFARSDDDKRWHGPHSI
jgi:hypothetical protein